MIPFSRDDILPRLKLPEFLQNLMGGIGPNANSGEAGRHDPITLQLSDVWPASVEPTAAYPIKSAKIARMDADTTFSGDRSLSPESLLSAYANGIFPMADPNGRIAWYSADPRGIIPLDRFHVSRHAAAFGEETAGIRRV